MTSFSQRLRTERRRVYVVVLICVVFALFGLANADIAHEQVVGAPVPDVNVSSAVVASGASSSAWYCAGPLPIGHRSERTLIAVANISDGSVTGKLLTSAVAGSVTSQAISVAGHAQGVFALSKKGKANFAAVTVIMNEAGVGVSEIVETPTGTSTAACTTHPSSDAYLALGGTKDPSNVTLSLYDPGSTPAVASISFATSSGPISPPIFQGLSVLAGQTINVDVGHYVFMKSLVASIVRAAGGHIVVGATETVPYKSGVLSSLATATAQPTTKWFLSAAPAGPAARQSFYVLNPTHKVAQVRAHLVSSTGAEDVNVKVGADGVSLFGLAPDPLPSALRWATITSLNGVPIVVARGTSLVTTVPGAPVPKLTPIRVVVPTPVKAGAKGVSGTTGKTGATGTAGTTGAKAPTKAAAKAKAPKTKLVVPKLTPAMQAVLMPQLAPGFGVTMGTTETATTWLLPGGQVSPSTGDVVTITNPTNAAVTINVRSLAPTSGEVGVNALAALVTLTIPAGQTKSVNLAVFVTLKYSVPLVVNATGPVIVGSLLYARGSSGSIGFSASAAIPVAQ